MKTIRSIERWIPWTQWQTGPTARRVESRLTRGNARPEGVYSIVTPWSCMAGHPETTDAQLLAPLGESYATEGEALRAAALKVPFAFAKHNRTINDRLHSSIDWQGTFMGPTVLADYVGVTLPMLYALARGERRATKAMADGARRYKGQRSYQGV